MSLEIQLRRGRLRPALVWTMVALTGVAGALSPMPAWAVALMLLIAIALAVHDGRRSNPPARIVLHDDETVSLGSLRGAPRAIAVNTLFVAFRVIAPQRRGAALGVFRDQVDAARFRRLRARLRS